MKSLEDSCERVALPTRCLC